MFKQHCVVMSCNSFPVGIRPLPGWARKACAGDSALMAAYPCLAIVATCAATNPRGLQPQSAQEGTCDILCAAAATSKLWPAIQCGARSALTRRTYKVPAGHHAAWPIGCAPLCP